MNTYIESIELNNFTSYPGKHTIGPFRRVNGVIGPNGAGKTNVLDAICFALGVKTPRDTKNLDQFLCFEQRSTGRRAASVTVSLHKNGTTHTLQRTVDPFGTRSEYRLNGKVLPFKDYCERLRKDFQLNVKTSNFAMFQGDVNRIAERTPAELVNLFEEVSGSIDFASEQASAEEAVDAVGVRHSSWATGHKALQLERRRMKQLKNEASEHLSLVRDLRSVQGKYACFKLLALEMALRASEPLLAEATSSLDKAKESASEAEVKLQQFRSTWQELQRDFLKSREAVAKQRSAHDAAAQRSAAAEKLSAVAQRKVAALHAKSTDTKGAIAHTKEAMERLEKDISTLEAQDAADVGAYQADAARRQALLTQEQWVEYRELKARQDAAQSSLCGALNNLVLRREAATDARDANAKELQRLQHRKQQLMTVAAACPAPGASAAESRAKLKEIENLRGVIAVTRKDQSARLKDIERSIAESDSELGRLASLQADNEMSSRNAMAAAKVMAEIPKVHGPLSDLVRVSSRSKYRLAVLAALGKYFDAVVVDTAGVAAEAVALLKATRVGRLSFVPLDIPVAKLRSVTAKELKNRGSARPLIEVVNFEETYSVAVRYAIGGLVVCDTAAEAKAIAWPKGGVPAHTAVSLDGNVYFTNGSYQCAGLDDLEKRSQKWDAADIERRREELRAAKSSARKEYDALCVARSEAEARDQELSLQFSEARTAVAIAEASSAAAQRQFADAQSSIDAVSEQIKGVEKVIEEKEAEIAETAGEEERQRAKIAQSQRAAFNDFKKRHKLKNVTDLELAALEDSLQADSRTFAARHSAYLVSLATMKGQLRMLQAGMKRAEDDAALYQQQIASAMKALEKSQEEALRCNQEVVSTNEKLVTLTDVCEAARKAAEQKRTEEQDVRRENDSLLRTVAQARRVFEDLSAVVARIRATRLSLLTEARSARTPIPFRDASTVDPADAFELPAPSNKKRSSSGQDKEQVIKVNFSEPILVAEFASDGAVQPPSDFYADSSDSSDDDAGSSQSQTQTQTQSNSQKGKTKQSAWLPKGATAVVVDFDAAGLIGHRLRAIASDRKSKEYAAECAAFQRVIDEADARIRVAQPNLHAVERFNELSERLTASEAEGVKLREELTNSNKILIAVEEKRAATFMTFFERLQKHVERIYAELSRVGGRPAGGTAVLSLDSQQRPWTGGCAYLVAPPGKAMVPLDGKSLSGGEKMVASLALNFAVHSVSPSPFMLLDEVDANLDVSCIKAVGSFLLSMRELQFIAVSHRHQLFSMCDSLIGVYKKVSSRAVTLDLIAAASP